MAGNCSYGDAASLENLALEVFVKNIVLKSTRNTVDLVREIMDQQNEVRKKCAQRCYEIFLNRPGQIKEDTFAIIDSTLDNHFKKLEVCVPFPALESFSDLMAIITHRCPKLEALKVSFRHKFKTALRFSKSRLDKGMNVFERKEQSNYTMPPESSLPCLKSLILDFDDAVYQTCHYVDESRESLLSIVGRLCPVLANLEVGRVCTNRMDVVALIVNANMADILFPKVGHGWSQDTVFRGLQIPSELLNPLCSTLKKLIIDQSSLGVPRQDSNSTFAFALRHLPYLEYLGLDKGSYYFPFCVVKQLYQVGNAVCQKGFEMAWRTAASSIGLDVASPTFFSGILSLKNLDYVSLYDSCSLLAVSLLCPDLEEVGFSLRGNDFSGDAEKTMKSWYKIKAVRVMGNNLNFLKMVLDIFGPKLKKMELWNIRGIDMAYLASICTELDQLTLGNSSVEKIESEAACKRWSPDTFLPKLMRFRTINNLEFNCLGFWGLLIEKKPTLVHLSLDCCHIGRKAHVEWSQLPKHWCELESLEMVHCTGLSMAMVADLIPRFTRLRHIGLPSSVIAQDPVLFQTIKENCSKRENSIKIEDRDNKFYGSVISCSIQQFM